MTTEPTPEETEPAVTIEVIEPVAPGKFESVKNVLRAWRTPILMAGAAITGAVITARALSSDETDDNDSNDAFAAFGTDDES